MSTDSAVIELPSRLRIVLVCTQHPGNIGSAARAIKTMGLQRLVLVAPERMPNVESAAVGQADADSPIGLSTEVSRRKSDLSKFEKILRAGGRCNRLQRRKP